MLSLSKYEGRAPQIFDPRGIRSRYTPPQSQAGALKKETRVTTFRVTNGPGAPIKTR